jgi:hypothetical protein
MFSFPATGWNPLLITNTAISDTVNIKYTIHNFLSITKITGQNLLLDSLMTIKYDLKLLKDYFPGAEM